MQTAETIYDTLRMDNEAPAKLAAMTKAQLLELGSHCACKPGLSKKGLVIAILGRMRESNLLRMRYQI